MFHETEFPESEVLVRFPDCDPFNHLNNSRYLDYFMNAREDHIMRQYGFPIYQYIREQGCGWVVAQNQIAYLRPALLMETVIIRSVLRELRESDILVEMLMFNRQKTEVKSVLWARFVHLDLKTGKRVPHPQNLRDIFDPLVKPLDPDLRFDDRVLEIRGLHKRNA